MDQPSVQTAQADRARAGGSKSGDELGVDATGEHLNHGVNHLGRGHSKAVDEAALHSTFGKKAGHLLAPAMHDDDLVSGLPSHRGNLRGQPPP